MMEKAPQIMIGVILFYVVFVYPTVQHMLLTGGF
jgi:hypothetical protein